MTSKRSFLVVDHDHEVCKRIANDLREAFSDSLVFEAYDGAEALSKLRNVPPTVLVCDINLSKIGGLDLIQFTLKAGELADTKIIALSEIPALESFVEGGSVGRIKSLIRPPVKEKLITCINGLLTARESKAEFQIKLLAKGEVLFRENEAASSAYLVKSGRLVAKSSARDEPIGEIVAGEFVGEMAHFSDEKRSATIEAIDQCELIEVPRGALDQMIFSKPIWARALLRTLCHRLRKANSPK